MFIFLFAPPTIAGEYERSYASRFGIGSRTLDVKNYSQDIGSHWARLPIDVNETNYNNYTLLFNAGDNGVTNYQSKGVVPFGIINPRKVTTWITAEQFAQAVAKIVERYDGDGVDDMPGLVYPIKVWELVNEYSSTSTGPMNQPSRALFIEMIRQGYQAIKSACSDCLIAYDPFDKNDTIALLNTVPASNIDIVSYHTYSPLDKPNFADSDYYILNLNNYLNTVGLTGKAVWGTEYAFYENPTKNGSVESGTITASQTDNARWFVQTTAYVLGKGLFDKFIYTEISSPNDGAVGSPLDWMALIDKNGNKRQLYYGFKRMSGLVDYFLSKEQLQLGTDVYGFKFKRAYENVYVLWSKEGTVTHNTTLTGLRGSIMTIKDSVPDTSNNFASDMSTAITGPTLSVNSLGSEPLYYVEKFQNIFSDVQSGLWYENYVYALYNHQITVGCGQNPLIYCPAQDVTRGQMAAFIIRAKFGENFTYTQTPYFSDVPANHDFFKYVQKMKDEAITRVDVFYDVEGKVTRGQMAAFIIRAKFGNNFTYTQTPYFKDVPVTHDFFIHVQKLKDENITTVEGIYNINQIVPREQMAAFIARAFLGMQ